MIIGRTQYFTILATGATTNLKDPDPREAVMQQMEGFQIRAFVGYSVWSEGLLEDEFAQKAWVVHRPDKTIIDPGNTDQLWKDLLRELSPWHKLVADEPDNLWLN